MNNDMISVVTKDHVNMQLEFYTIKYLAMLVEMRSVFKQIKKDEVIVLNLIDSQTLKYIIDWTLLHKDDSPFLETDVLFSEVDYNFIAAIKAKYRFKLIMACNIRYVLDDEVLDRLRKDDAKKVTPREVKKVTPNNVQKVKNDPKKAIQNEPQKVVKNDRKKNTENNNLSQLTTFVEPIIKKRGRFKKIVTGYLLRSKKILAKKLEKELTVFRKCSDADKVKRNQILVEAKKVTPREVKKVTPNNVQKVKNDPKKAIQNEPQKVVKNDGKKNTENNNLSQLTTSKVVYTSKIETGDEIKIIDEDYLDALCQDKDTGTHNNKQNMDRYSSDFEIG
uniref:BTB domain-containing protein n=1 Tax=Rhabditophanes sp. KR3021 TaxID=114890 RepID=A0AC35TJ12_9BILA